jgi:hypothetical protein
MTAAAAAAAVIKTRRTLRPAWEAATYHPGEWAVWRVWVLLCVTADSSDAATATLAGWCFGSGVFLYKKQKTKQKQDKESFSRFRVLRSCSARVGESGGVLPMPQVLDSGIRQPRFGGLVT